MYRISNLYEKVSVNIPDEYLNKYRVVLIKFGNGIVRVPFYIMLKAIDTFIKNSLFFPCEIWKNFLKKYLSKAAFDSCIFVKLKISSALFLKLI